MKGWDIGVYGNLILGMMKMAGFHDSELTVVCPLFKSCQQVFISHKTHKSKMHQIKIISTMSCICIVKFAQIKNSSVLQ